MQPTDRSDAPVSAALPPLARAAAAMRVGDVDALLIGPGADLRYLTGYHALQMERLTLLVVRSDDRYTLIVPTLERPRASASELPAGVELVDVGETTDPFKAVVAALADHPTSTLAVDDKLWSVFLLGLQQVLPATSWIPGSSITRELRMIKGPAELSALRRAGQAIDRVHRRVSEMLEPGRTEAEVGRDIATAIVEEGHDEVAFIIVGSGPNSASPHHETGSRTIKSGDAVVVDIGGFVDGYASDCTRNYVVGSPPRGYEDAHRVLEVAQAAACRAARPGVTAASVDSAARDVLDDAGYGPFFIHRLGHGIGLEVHEDPYIVSGNDGLLEPGMTFSIEPGIYLPERYGMRIEDIVVVTSDGIERLNTADRTFVVVE